MSRPARSACARAYQVLRRWVALAPAYPPLSGEPFLFSATPLLNTMTLLPGRIGGGRGDPAAQAAARADDGCGVFRVHGVLRVHGVFRVHGALQGFRVGFMRTAA